MSDQKNTYKDTLNLPRTAFDMKANLLAKEPAIQGKWKERNLYGQIRDARLDAPRFILHDGPPYANGNIHMGTALNKVLKDMVVRIKNMSGMDSPYVPGWDCHGLPIEQKVMDELGANAGSMTPMDIRARCRDYAARFAALQSEQFQRLGVMGEFDNPYITMAAEYEAATLEVFAKLVEKGLVYKQLKPVHWSIENRTALADAELEYHDRTDPSIYVAFELDALCARKVPHREGDKVALLIWTTTPWTLPANLAVAVHPDLAYCCVHAETADGPVTMVIVENRLEAVLGAVRARRAGYLGEHEVLSRISGTELCKLGLSYRHPIHAGRQCPVVPADYVTTEDGTGLVHTAPGHGLEDYGTGLKHGLEIYCPVRDDGTFDNSVPEFLRGLTVWKANPLVVEHLAKAKSLVLEEPVTHSYPHDWRSKTPTIFRATEQWFIAVDRPRSGGEPSLRKQALAVVSADSDAIRFVPYWGRNRIAGMLESRPDWCISRQRAWGLPIPAFYNPDGQPLLTPATVRAVADVFRHQGSDAWFTLSPGELLAGYDVADDPHLAGRADQFAVASLTKGRDIFDVWFESGSSWYAVAMQRGLVSEIPVDLYLEGSDQHRGWFQLSLLPALGTLDKPPFGTLLTHGFVVDETGRKMSKSLGNTIDVIAQLNKRGADILRLWVASQNYQDDIRCSEKLIAQAEDGYRKIRNTLRYAMGACCDFDPAADATEPAAHSVDLWMRMQLHILIRDVREAYDRYEFHRAARLLYEFCTVQASSIYMAAVKDRLYCESPTAVRRRATQTVMHEVLMALVKLLAPILPHTCDEAWDHIPNRPADEPAGVHLAALPDYDQAILRLAEDLRPVNPDQATSEGARLHVGPAWIWNELMDLRQAGLAKLEALKNAGVKNSLDAEAVFRVRKGDPAAELIRTYLREMEDLLGVGYARVEEVDQVAVEGTLAVEVEVADARDRYGRCARSWKRRPDVGSDAQYPDLCARDAAVMKELRS